MIANILFRRWVQPEGPTLGDSLELLPEVRSNSVGLVVTSLPFKRKDGYSSVFCFRLANELYRVQRKDSLAFINFKALRGEGDPHRELEVACFFQAAGYRKIAEIVWLKHNPATGEGNFAPLSGSDVLNDLYEPIFVFAKGRPKLARTVEGVGAPYSDPSNQKRWNGQRKNNGLRCGGNVWFIPYPPRPNGAKVLHKDYFPDEVARRCILLSGVKKKTLVLDPCSGSGTVGVVARELGMRYLGIERNAEHIATQEQRLS